MPCQILFEAWVWSVSYSTAQSSAALRSTNDQIWGLQAPIGRTKPKNIDGEKLYFISLTSNWNIRDYANTWFSSVQSLSRVRLCDPMNRSTPGLPVHHQLPESTQTHVHWVGDAIQPSHPLSSPSPPALNLSQHQGLFKWLSSSYHAVKVLEFQLQHQSFQWTSQDWYPLGWIGWISLQSKGFSRVFSNTIVQKHQFFGAQICL